MRLLPEKTALKQVYPIDKPYFETDFLPHKHLTIQVEYTKTAAAPDGILSLEVRASSSAPWVPALDANQNPIQIQMNVNGYNDGRDVVEYSGVWEKLRLVYQRNTGWIDPSPQLNGLNDGFFTTHIVLAS